MSVQNLLHAQPSTQSPHSAAARAQGAGASFQERLAQTSAVGQGPDVSLRKPAGQTVFSGGCAGRLSTFQEIYAEYTADSTPQDPVVRVSGRADSGPYDFTCRVNEIDPSNASYAELAALYGHLVKTGAYQSGLPSSQIPHVLPHTVEFQGDATRKRNFFREIQESLQSPHLDAAAGAEELLALYQPYASGSGPSSLDQSVFMRDDPLSDLEEAKRSMLTRMKAGKEKSDEQEDWERLMRYVDAWIESLREKADLEKAARAKAALEKAREDAAQGRKDLMDKLLDRLEERLSQN